MIKYASQLVMGDTVTDSNGHTETITAIEPGSTGYCQLTLVDDLGAVAHWQVSTPNVLICRVNLSAANV